MISRHIARKSSASRYHFSAPVSPFRGVGNHPAPAARQLVRDAAVAKSLTRRQRMALTLFKEGYKQRQIGRLLGIKHRQAVNALIARAKRRLKEIEAALDD